MPRAKKIEGNLDAIAARRAELEAELARVTEAERRAREAERDAGRDVLLAALGKVKIARMDRSEATAIAKAIEKHGAKRIAEKLRSEEHTSELQSLMRTSYAVFCLKKKIYSTTAALYTSSIACHLYK